MTNRLPVLYKVLVSQMQPAPSRGMDVRFAFYSISVRFQIKTYSAAETFVDIFAHFFFHYKANNFNLLNFGTFLMLSLVRAGLASCTCKRKKQNDLGLR